MDPKFISFACGIAYYNCVLTLFSNTVFKAAKSYFATPDPYVFFSAVWISVLQTGFLISNFDYPVLKALTLAAEHELVDVAKLVATSVVLSFIIFYK